MHTYILRIILPQITRNGLIIFGSMPIPDNPFVGGSLSIPIITLFWFGGLPGSSVLHYRVVEDNDTLSEVAAITTEFNSNLTHYKPTLAVVATWQLTTIVRGK